MDLNSRAGKILQLGLEKKERSWGVYPSPLVSSVEESSSSSSKTRFRTCKSNFQVGEHVRVLTTFFDDLTMPGKDRYSETIHDTHVSGIITQVTNLSYKVLFEDSIEAFIPKAHVEVVLRSQSNVITAGNSDDNDNIDDNDPDWDPNEDKYPELDSEDDIDLAVEVPERQHFLINGKKKLFIAKLHPTEPGDTVHHKVLKACERKFEIIKVIDAHHWSGYDEELHSVGSFIAWDIGATELKVTSRRPVDGMETVIPVEDLVKYKNHYHDGCDEGCSPECVYLEDKVYNEWSRLLNTSPERTPEKTLKRLKVNKKEARKKLKLEGKPYTTESGKRVEGRKPCEWVDCKCRNKCGEVLTMLDRENIYTKYWAILNHNERKQYIVARMQSDTPKQRTTKETSRRGQTLLYFLDKDDNTRVPVCSKVFLATLQVTQKLVRYTWDHTEQGFSKRDGRGFSSTPKHKLSEDQIEGVREHLDSFAKVPAHYVRKDSTKIYIEDNSNFSRLTIGLMHKLYLQKCEKDNSAKPVGYDSYRNIFSSLNYAIHKPKKDQCKICVKFKRSSAEVQVAEKKKYDQHIMDNKTVMKLKIEYKNKGKENEDLLIFNFDLEAVLYTPCDKVSTIFYKRKLCTYNCTTFNLVTKSGDCFIWNETEGKRGSNEIATSLYLYLQNTKATEVVMFSDTCGGQNRNQFVAAMLLYIVRTHPTIKSLDFIFMVQGHSHMEVDNMHSAIERKSSDLKIYSPYGWEIVASIARRNPYHVHSLKYDDFIDTKQLKKDLKITNVKVNNLNERVKWNNDDAITWMRFEKEHTDKIFYKLNYDKNELFKEIPISRRTRLVDIARGYQLPYAYNSRLKLSGAKLKDLLDLCQDLTIPTSYHDFYNEVAKLGTSDETDGGITDSDNSDDDA